METDYLDPRHPKFDERKDCPHCNGTGIDYNTCPYCESSVIYQHHDAGTYCADCGSLEGVGKNEWLDCIECNGKGYTI